jgi:peptide-methionine (S)-S-oxide reductase
MEKLVLGGGCFWCTEAVFQRVKGVTKVVSGYSGGKYPNPSYREICEGNSGHVEVIEISFDAQQISVAELLLIFFHTHDPTTLNRQGNDVGTQYRSVIFYANESQKLEAEELMIQLEKEQIFDAPIITELSPLTAFYPAEAYHQDYYNQNSYQPYCSVIIAPKIAKFLNHFSEKAATE